MRLRAASFLLLACALVVAIEERPAFGQQQDRTPEARPVSAVVADLYFKNSGETREAATQALAKLGTNALPYLMEEVRVLGKIQDADWTNFDVTPELQIRKFNVDFAFKTLGPVGKPAVPELDNLLKEGNGPLIAADALSRIDESDAASAFIHALTNSILNVRVAAASRLGGLDTGISADLAVPPLIECLNYESADPHSAWLRAYSAAALGHIHGRADLAVPALLRRLPQEQDPAAPNCRFFIVRALGRFGIDAQLAVPELRKLANDPDPIVSREANLALKQIGNKSK